MKQLLRRILFPVSAAYSSPCWRHVAAFLPLAEIPRLAMDSRVIRVARQQLLTVIMGAEMAATQRAQHSLCHKPRPVVQPQAQHARWRQRTSCWAITTTLSI